MNTPRILKILAVVAIVFGAITVVSGGRALFGGAQARAAVGNAVDFVLWFNFVAGFAYVATGIGLWLAARWSAPAAVLLALATAAVAAAFGLHVAQGAPFEMRTVGALVLRLGFWVVLAVVAMRVLRQRKNAA